LAETAKACPFFCAGVTVLKEGDGMNGNERRRNPRYETEMRAVLYAKNDRIAAIMIDIGECCMGLISEQEISPGTEVRIVIKHVDEYTIHGKVVWSSLIRETPKKLFRMGIETSSIIVLGEIAETGFPERSDYLNSLLAERRPVKSVLVIDDEREIRALLKEALEKFGYEVTVAVDGEEGLKLFRKHPADLVITDIFMPNKDGHQLILDMTKEFPGVNIIAITGKVSHSPDMELDLAEMLGAAKTFQKPVRFRALLDAINELEVKIEDRNSAAAKDQNGGPKPLLH
jgi:CheY-like chemotaxis protein